MPASLRLLAAAPAPAQRRQAGGAPCSARGESRASAAHRRSVGNTIAGSPGPAAAPTRATGVLSAGGRPCGVDTSISCVSARDANAAASPVSPEAHPSGRSHGQRSLAPLSVDALHGLPPIVEQNARATGTDVAGYLTESPGCSARSYETTAPS